MGATVKRVPEGFHTVTPYLIFKDAAPAMEFYARAFGATELFRKTDDDGKIRHAEMMIGTSPIMLAGEFGELPDWQSAETRGGSPVHLYLYVEDCDALFARALAAGRRSCCRCGIRSTATARAGSPTRSGTCGGWRAAFATSIEAPARGQRGRDPVPR